MQEILPAIKRPRLLFPRVLQLYWSLLGLLNIRPQLRSPRLLPSAPRRRASVSPGRTCSQSSKPKSQPKESATPIPAPPMPGQPNLFYYPRHRFLYLDVRNASLLIELSLSGPSVRFGRSRRFPKGLPMAVRPLLMVPGNVRSPACELTVDNLRNRGSYGCSQLKDNNNKFSFTFHIRLEYELVKNSWELQEPHRNDPASYSFCIPF